MMSKKVFTRRDLSFANETIRAELYTDVQGLMVDDGIVVNLDVEPLLTGGGDVPGIVPGLRSTWLHGGEIIKARRCAVIGIRNQENLGRLMFHGWKWLGSLIESFPRDTPLFMSPQDEIGIIKADPCTISLQGQVKHSPAEFRVKLNLWWAPEDTDCFIHNKHSFLEVHSQIYGRGRMQKFRERDSATLYENVLMQPGFTHDPFCRVTDDGEFRYPWHRYYADTSSIWLAIELHPVD